MSWDRSNTCRFCKKTTWSSELIKYGTRAYAHPACYAQRKTMQDAARLPLMEKRKLEAFICEHAIPIEIAVERMDSDFNEEGNQ